MKFIYILLVFIILSFNPSKTFSENKILYLDVDYLLAKSQAGMSIKAQLENIYSKKLKNYTDQEETFKIEEKKILSKKNIISTEDFNKELKIFQTKIESYNQEKKNTISEIKKKRDEATKALLLEINKILADYSDKNSVSLIINKNDIVMAKSELDITEDILNLTNEKISKININ